MTCCERLKRRNITGVLLLCALLLAASGCPGNGARTATQRSGDESPAALNPDPAPTEAATIAYTGNWRGFQVPCGCNDEQYGGWPRNTTLISKLRSLLAGESVEQSFIDLIGKLPAQAASQPLWVFDLGNFAWRSTYFADMRARTHLRELELVGAKAAVPGSEELQLTPEQALFVFEDSPVPIVSANLRARDAKIVIEPYVELAPGWYFTGLSSWAPAVGIPPPDVWWEMEDAAAAITRVVSSLPADAKVIVSAQNQTSEVIRTTAQLPQVLSILGFDIGPETVLPEDWARIYAPPDGRGKHLYLVGYDLRGPEPLQAKTEVFLGTGWPDDQRSLDMVKAEREQVTARLQEGADAQAGDWKDVEWGQSDKYLPQKEMADKERQTLLQEAARGGYTGPDKCLECHSGEHELWAATKHAHAIDVLVKKGEQNTLDCLKCHTTGLLEPGGYNPVKPVVKLASVSCENCHGPGAAHSAQMAGEMKAAADKGIVRSDLNSCLRCHDEYNSPRFEKNAYWEKIRH